MPKQLYTTQKKDDFGVENLYKGSIYETPIYNADPRSVTPLYDNQETEVKNLYKEESDVSDTPLNN